MNVVVVEAVKFSSTNEKRRTIESETCFSRTNIYENALSRVELL